MKRYFNFLFFIFLTFIVITCKQDNLKVENETIIKGETTILVDETLKPIVEDLVEVFESHYKAKITIDAKSEAEVIRDLMKDSAKIAILARTLSKDEIKFFKNKTIKPRITPFAKDAIGFITNKNNKDSLISLIEITNFMKGIKPSKIEGLVFDNFNSSNARVINGFSKIEKVPSEGVFSFKTNNEVINYVAQNNGMIGIIGINYIFEPSENIAKSLNKINVLQVLNTIDNKYYSPTQNNIAEGTYPLARDLFIVNAQGYSGLGMGFSSFIAGEIGQRIVLKSGLVPVRFPSRKILVRNKINNDKK